MTAVQKVRARRYRPRHAKPVIAIVVPPSPRDLFIAEELDRMREDLMARNFKQGHRRGAINWFAYCLALSDVAAYLRGEL